MVNVTLLFCDACGEEIGSDYCIDTTVHSNDGEEGEAHLVATHCLECFDQFANEVGSKLESWGFNQISWRTRTDKERTVLGEYQTTAQAESAKQDTIIAATKPEEAE